MVPAFLSVWSGRSVAGLRDIRPVVGRCDGAGGGVVAPGRSDTRLWTT